MLSIVLILYSLCGIKEKQPMETWLLLRGWWPWKSRKASARASRLLQRQRLDLGDSRIHHLPEIGDRGLEALLQRNGGLPAQLLLR